MNNNYKVQMHREANAGSITTREFARDNNINALKLRSFLRHDDTIRCAFTRNRTNYYSIEKITKWLKKNIERFNGAEKNIDNRSCVFFCNRDTVYKPIELRRKKGCCVDCIEKSIDRIISTDKDDDHRERVHAARVRVDDIKSMRSLENNITEGWMYELDI